MTYSNHIENKNVNHRKKCYYQVVSLSYVSKFNFFFQRVMKGSTVLVANNLVVIVWDQFVIFTLECAPMAVRVDISLPCVNKVSSNLLLLFFPS